MLCNGRQKTGACPYGYKCCGDNWRGDHKAKRRALKRRERQAWRNETANAY